MSVPSFFISWFVIVLVYKLMSFLVPWYFGL